MRTIVSLITAAAFLLHFTLGCCSHHAHAAEGSNCRHHENGSDHRCCHHHGHGDQAPAEEGPDESQPAKRSCSEGECVFMTAAKTVVAKTVFQAALPPCADEVALRMRLSPAAIDAVDSGGPHTLPVRIHLFNQVFLI